MSKVILLGFFVDRPWPLVTYLKFTKHDHLSQCPLLAATKNISSPICVLTTLFIFSGYVWYGLGPTSCPDVWFRRSNDSADEYHSQLYKASKVRQNLSSSLLDRWIERTLKLMILNFRSAQKYDEVATLEQNLRELKEEYWRQRQENGQCWDASCHVSRKHTLEHVKGGFSLSLFIFFTIDK